MWHMFLLTFTLINFQGKHHIIFEKVNCNIHKLTINSRNQYAYKNSTGSGFIIFLYQ